MQRRFQLRGSVGGVTVIDDYAHHPTEVRVTLEAAREQGWARLVAVFQPHRYSRTQLLGRDLGAALSDADLAVITDVYGAGEQPVPGVTGKSVVDGLLAARPRARVAYLPKRGEVADFVAGRVDPGDLVLTIGAGDITMLADEVLHALTERAARKGCTVSPADRAAEIMRAGAHGRVERDHAVGPLTSYGLGGDAAVFLEAEGDQDLQRARRALESTGLPLLMLGTRARTCSCPIGGSPASRSGWGPGSGGRASKVLASRREPGCPCRASPSCPGSTPSPAWSSLSPSRPRSGGAVRMNAGAHGHSVGEVLHEADVFRIGSAVRERIPAGRLGFSYRSTDLPADAVVVGAGFALTPGDESEIKDKLREAREWRRANQPLNLPNAGSVFKNPPGDAAGRIIEQVCGKGLRVGGAQISEIHANFIVASAGARADDVYTLIRRIQRRVKEETGIELEPEVRLVGEFEEVEDGASAR